MHQRRCGNQVFLTERQSDRLIFCSQLEKKFVSQIEKYTAYVKENKKPNREVWFKKKKEMKIGHEVEYSTRTNEIYILWPNLIHYSIFLGNQHHVGQ